MRRVGAKEIVQSIGFDIIGIRIGNTFEDRVVVEDGQLTLLVHRHLSVVKALVHSPAFSNVTHVPFADMAGGISGLLQNFCQDHFVAGQTETRDINHRVAHTHANWQTACHLRDACRRAGGFGIHADKAHRFARKSVDIWCLIPVNSVQFRDALIAEPKVINQDAEDVRGFATI